MVFLLGCYKLRIREQGYPMILSLSLQEHRMSYHLFKSTLMPCSFLYMLPVSLGQAEFEEF